MVGQAGNRVNLSYSLGCRGGSITRSLDGSNTECLPPFNSFSAARPTSQSLRSKSSPLLDSTSVWWLPNPIDRKAAAWNLLYLQSNNALCNSDCQSSNLTKSKITTSSATN